MGSNATASTAAASGGVAGAISVLLVWILSLVHVDMPPDAVVAVTVILAAAIHGGWLRFGADQVTDTTAVVAGNPTPVQATVKTVDAPAAAQRDPMAPMTGHA